MLVRKHANIARTVRMEQLFWWFINDQKTGGLDPFVANLTIYQMLNELELSSAEKDVKISPLANQTYRLIKIRFSTYLFVFPRPCFLIREASII